jgi:hypothetical protein
MTNNTEQQAVPVAQEDREAAAKLFGFPAWENVAYIEDRAMSTRIREAAQAFARHRLASLPCKSGEGAGEVLAVASRLQQARHSAVEPVERDNVLCEAATLLRRIAALTPDATQTREAELRDRIARAVYQDAPDSNPGDKHRSVAWDYASEHSRARAYRVADAALNARGGA